MQSVGRNDPCPCGSGKKAKHCCHRLEASGHPDAFVPAALDAGAHFNQANLLLTQGKPELALDHLERALALRPDYAEAHLTLGQLFWTQGDAAAAAASLERGLALLPHLAEAHSNLGLVYGALKQYDAAVESLRKAIALKPDFAWAYCNLGNVLSTRGDLPAAVESYRHALAIDPGHVESWVNLGNTLNAQDDFDAAVECYRKAVSLQPDQALAWVNICAPLQAQGKIDAAIECLRKALALKRDYAEAHSGLLYLLSFHAAYSPAERLAEARRYGAAVMAQASALPRRLPHANDRAPTPKRLRVGLVSGDLRTHPVGFFIESILAHLDPARIELVAYPTLAREDETTARLKPKFAAWHSLVDLSDATAASRIHGDGIQILIDLAGHSANNRLPVFAWRPAPVQASWLGYFATTGVPTMDYLLADRRSVPEALREQFSETIWYLPDTRFCFTPPAADAGLEPAPLPATRNGYITFGCFQNALKLNPALLALWGRILAALPEARLKLLARDCRYPAARARQLDRLQRCGIAPGRVTLVGHLPREEYLRAHAEVDIMLDTFPYAGATTTCEALWMGVPTVTLAGDTLVSRQGASLLACAGLDDWIATDGDDYVRRAVAHATDRDGLARLRAGLRRRVLATPLFDAPRFARNLQAALEAMWRQGSGDRP